MIKKENATAETPRPQRQTQRIQFNSIQFNLLFLLGVCLGGLGVSVVAFYFYFTGGFSGETR
jgi:hypothetical protein